MKRKICYIIAMLLVMTFAGNAQKTVFQNLTWEQAAELAQKENKNFSWNEGKRHGSRPK